FSYIEPGLDYLQYPPSPSYGVPMSLPTSGGSPTLAFNSLSLPNGMSDYTYGSPTASFTVTTPPDGASISPPSLTYNLSAGELSSSDTASSSGRNSRGSGTHSPPHGVPYAATVPRSHRFNPMGVAANRPKTQHGWRASRDADSEDDDFQPQIPATADSPIESEQRRRDELRDGYARLKVALPASNQKSSKVSLLNRTTGHLRYLNTMKEQSELEIRCFIAMYY
ncbi:hypothetical protein BDN72DRAFT_763226, partial [Pluteus cervinus]